MIATLPINYRGGRKIKVYTTLFNAYVLSKITGQKLLVPVNLIGLRNDINRENDEQILSTILDDLPSINISGITKENIFFDLCPEFREFVTTTVLSKIPSSTNTEIIRCPCGVVELGQDAYETIDKERRAKRFKGQKCNKCGGDLDRTTARTSAIEALIPENVTCYPQVQAERLRIVMGEMARHPITLTKNRKPGINDISVDSDTVIDPDCLLVIFLVFLCKRSGLNSMDLVIGFTTLPQACRAFLVSYFFFKEISFRIFIHPGIKFGTQDDIMPRTPLSEYGGQYKPCDWINAILMSNQAKRLESSLCPSDIGLSETTRRHVSVAQTPLGAVDFSEAVDLVSRDTMVRILRKARQRIQLSNLETTLINALF